MVDRGKGQLAAQSAGRLDPGLYCNLALATYGQDFAHAPDQRGIALVAISPQTPDGSLTMREKHDLPFAVLSDPGNQIAGALGILTGPSPQVREAQLAHGLDLTTINADGTTTLPMPTVAIVDAEGRLAWIDVHPDYSTSTEPQLGPRRPRRTRPVNPNGTNGGERPDHLQ